MSKEITTRGTYSLGKPSEMVALAAILRDHIKKNSLSVAIQGKNYTYVEGWQFAGGLMGLFPKIVEVKKVEGEEIKWFCEAHIINAKTGEVMSTGFALCSKKENKKSGFDEYAVLSMAQTRAIGKAYRNLIGWVMKMAGSEATPAEEVKRNENSYDSDKMYSEAIAKIKACKNIATLKSYSQKISSSKKYNEDQKIDLIQEIDKKIIDLS